MFSVVTNFEKDWFIFKKGVVQESLSSIIYLFYSYIWVSILYLKVSFDLFESPATSY